MCLPVGIVRPNDHRSHRGTGADSRRPASDWHVLRLSFLGVVRRLSVVDVVRDLSVVGVVRDLSVVGVVRDLFVDFVELGLQRYDINSAPGQG